MSGGCDGFCDWLNVLNFMKVESPKRGVGNLFCKKWAILGCFGFTKQNRPPLKWGFNVQNVQNVQRAGAL